jgi:hypothetical protein
MAESCIPDVGARLRRAYAEMDRSAGELEKASRHAPSLVEAAHGTREVAKVLGDAIDALSHTTRPVERQAIELGAIVNRLNADTRVTGQLDEAGYALRMVRSSDILSLIETAFRAQVLLSAARELRSAQRAYLADRGNESLGRSVGEAAEKLDDAIRSLAIEEGEA